MEAFYMDLSKCLTLWVMTGKTIVAKKLLNLVVVLSIVAEWAAEMPRTPKELVQMIKVLIKVGQMEQNCPQQADFKLLTDFGILYVVI